jgi:transposase-like protein
MEVYGMACPNPECENFGRRGTGEIVRASRLGKRRRRQRFRCNACGRTFVGTSGTFMYGLRIPREAFLDVLLRHHSGETIQSIAESIGVGKDTVLRVFDKTPAYREQVKEALVAGCDVPARTAEEIVQLMEHRARQKKTQRRLARAATG